jgi:hypothetical protein
MKTGGGKRATAPVIGALALVACATTANLDATVAVPEKITAAPDAVTVIVVQPKTQLRDVQLVEGHGQLVGQLEGPSHTVLKLREGPTVLYASLGNDAATVDRIEGTLISGRTYYALVEPRDGGVALLALTPRTPGDLWSRKAELLAATPRLALDPQKVTRVVNELGDLDPILRAGDARADRLDPAATAARTLQETDGF